MRFPNHPDGQYWVTFLPNPCIQGLLIPTLYWPRYFERLQLRPKTYSACLPIFLTIVGFYAKIQSIKKEEIDTFFYTNFPKKIKTTISKLCMKKG